MNNKLIKLLIFVVSVSVICLIVLFVLDNTGKINQGKFMINDFVVTSTANVEELQDKTESSAEIKSLSDFKINVSQNNELSFLVAPLDNTTINEVYIDNIIITNPKQKGDIILYQNEENKINLSKKNNKIDIFKTDYEGQYLIKFNIDNINCVTNVSIPDNKPSIVFDGTIFDVLNIKASDIKYNIKFNLNVVDSNGRINVCKVNLDIPSESIVKDGIVITKEDLRNYNFYIK